MKNALSLNQKNGYQPFFKNICGYLVPNVIWYDQFNHNMYKNKKNTVFLMTFDTLSLHAQILKGLKEAGYSEPTKIQSKAIPKAVKGFDLRASAQTGTGKTAAFLLPALNRLLQPAAEQGKGKGPRILILAPTRELAMQIATQAEKYSKYLQRVKTVCIGGGVPYHTQLRKLSRPYDILVATPGRLIDFLEQKKINLSRVEMLVLDEADRMLDMGFLDPVEEIVSHTPSTRQTLLFSATLQGSVLKLSEKLLNKPMDIVVHSEREKHENITQKLHYVDDRFHKNRILDHILGKDDVQQAIIFTSTKRFADQLVLELRDKSHRAAALHGDMNQRQRTRTIGQLRDGKIKILVATDVAARGIDVNSISHVINFDLPRNTEDYVHRIGRTGRAGAKGTAFSFAAGQDVLSLKEIEKYTGQPVEVTVIPGLEPTPPKKSSKPGKGPRSGPAKKRRFKPGFKSDSRPSSKPGSKPGARRGAKSSARPGSKPGAKPKYRKGFKPKNKRA